MNAAVGQRCQAGETGAKASQIAPRAPVPAWMKASAKQEQERARDKDTCGSAARLGKIKKEQMVTASTPYD